MVRDQVGPIRVSPGFGWVLCPLSLPGWKLSLDLLVTKDGASWKSAKGREREFSYDPEVLVDWLFSVKPNMFLLFLFFFQFFSSSFIEM